MEILRIFLLKTVNLVKLRNKPFLNPTTIIGVRRSCVSLKLIIVITEDLLGTGFGVQFSKKLFISRYHNVISIQSSDRGRLKFRVYFMRQDV